MTPSHTENAGGGGRLTTGSFCTGIDRRTADPQRVKEMYALYLSGKSLARVATAFGVTRQSVYSVFSGRSLPLRTKKKLAFVEFEGERYTLNKQGYYRCTRGRKNTKFLHQQVWISLHGPIPFGFDIHHKDENKSNNAPANLECIAKPDHTRLHNPQMPIEDKNCAWCGKKLVRRESSILEGPAALAKRKFCNHKCAAAWKRRKPRGAFVAGNPASSFTSPQSIYPVGANAGASAACGMGETK
jgi:hypothetical protein